MKLPVLACLLACACACAAEEESVQCAEHGQLIPDPLDCASFYQCSFGTPVLLRCPPGLAFDARDGRCDFPSDEELCAAPVQCPDKGEDDLVVQVPNPDDCSSFYKCDEAGIPHLNPCPPGLHYNAAEQVCDFPASAGCEQRLLQH